MLFILTGNSTRKTKEQPCWRYTKKEAAKGKLALERSSNELVVADERASLYIVRAEPRFKRTSISRYPRYDERNWEAQVLILRYNE